MPRRTPRPVAVLLALLAAVVLVGASITLVARFLHRIDAEPTVRLDALSVAIRLVRRAADH